MKLHRLAEQPDVVDIRLVDGVFVKSTTFTLAGTVAPQHAHVHDHLSAIVSGGARVFADGELLGEFFAPAFITIKARVKHRFETLAHMTTVLCIHNADRAEDVAIHEEHQLEIEEA